MIDRCMTDESILRTELLKEMPDEHRPDDQFIAAKLGVDHEFKKRMIAGLQRKVKRVVNDGMGTGYDISDEVWAHFKPTEEQLEKWMNEEGRGEERIDEQAALDGDPGDTVNSTRDSYGADSDATTDGETTSLMDADEGRRLDDSQGKTALPSDGTKLQSHHDASSTTLQDKSCESTMGPGHTNVSAATAGGASNDAPQDTWLGVLPALRDGP
jgi:platelet-activating factor acetylhydrolase